jgi:hypothetical protein
VTVFLNGATVMACFVAVLFFVRFRRRTGDVLFARFAVAFALLGAHWTALALTAPAYEFRPFLYLIRLFAFLVILYAIYEKNRRRVPRAVRSAVPG